ncbi:MAG: putative sulfate exporter family transporter, partial [Spirochaetales bacterium]|nr:putative sulfate exporter family transporter [Spirochaetales bacterium]
MKKLSYIYGIALCIAVGSIAVFSSSYIPIGAVAISIILGIAIGNISKLNKIFDKGISFSEKKLLSLAIALMGVNLDFMILKDIGYKSIILVIS